MTDLTDRLRTCVAHLATIKISEVLVDSQMEAIIDARKLLVEAADTLDEAGVGMVAMDTQTALALDVIPPQPPPEMALYSTPLPQPGINSGIWYDSGPGTITGHQPSRNACPACDSHAHKTVHRGGVQGLMLECPVCGHMWKR